MPTNNPKPNLKPNLYWVWRLPNDTLRIKRAICNYAKPLEPDEFLNWNADHPEQRIKPHKMEKTAIMQAVTLNEFKLLIGRSSAYTHRKPFRGVHFSRMQDNIWLIGYFTLLGLFAGFILACIHGHGMVYILVLWITVEIIRQGVKYGKRRKGRKALTKESSQNAHQKRDQ